MTPGVGGWVGFGKKWVGGRPKSCLPPGTKRTVRAQTCLGGCRLSFRPPPLNPTVRRAVIEEGCRRNRHTSLSPAHSGSGRGSDPATPLVRGAAWPLPRWQPRRSRRQRQPQHWSPYRPRLSCSRFAVQAGGLSGESSELRPRISPHQTFKIPCVWHLSENAPTLAIRNKVKRPPPIPQRVRGRGKAADPGLICPPRAAINVPGVSLPRLIARNSRAPASSPAAWQPTSNQASLSRNSSEIHSTLA